MPPYETASPFADMPIALGNARIPNLGTPPLPPAQAAIMPLLEAYARFNKYPTMLGYSFTPLEQAAQQQRAAQLPLEQQTRTGMVLPRSANMATGEGSLAVPQIGEMAIEAAKLPGDVAAGRVDPLSDEAIRRSMDIAGFSAGVSPNTSSRSIFPHW